MKTLKLQKTQHNTKIGSKCPFYSPNVTEDCLLELDGEVIGFYIKDLNNYNKQLTKLISIANKEFQSDNVPKQEMSRGPQGSKKDKLQRQLNGNKLVTQFSTILGSRAPKPHMRQPYASRSLIHQNRKITNLC